MWSLGMPYLEDVSGMVRKLLNILNRCVKVYCQMISLLFVFCQLIVMQVWWIKACPVNASMTTDYMISAKLEQYTCMVDLLYPAGHLEDAENMINTMPCKPDVASWMALLGTCRIHGNVEMA
jgi:hypothetical protein